MTWQDLRAFMPMAVPVIIGAFLLLFIWLVFLSVRLGRIRRLLAKLVSETEQPFDRLLEKILAKQEENQSRIVALEDKAVNLFQTLQGCIQHVGLVRFDAFSDTAGQQSFSVALLDNQGSGVVVTSLFGRTESRCYAKPITRGNSNFPLSEEEETAIRQAMERVMVT